MGNLKQIRLCGYGGQGVVLAGTILGRAAIIDGQWVSGSNAYGSQARGGVASSELVISDQPIKYPHVIESDILIALSQEAYSKYVCKSKKSGAVVFYDTRMIEPQDFIGCRQIGISAVEEAISGLGSQQSANMVMLGASVTVSGCVDHKSLLEAVNQSVSQRYLEINLKALELGRQLGERI